MTRTNTEPIPARGDRRRGRLRTARAAVIAVSAAAAAAFSLALAPIGGMPALAAPTTPNVAPIDAAGLKRLVQSRKGQVVVVNFWATWCIPCEEELPGFARLQRTYGGRGVSVITVSFDDRHDAAGKVSPFLARTGMMRDTFIDRVGSTDPDQAYFDFLEPSLAKDAAVPLPRTYIFARNGREVKAYAGVPLTFAALEKTITPLLK
jgi:thiol-disulfide isomerase/thioredoxin